MKKLLIFTIIALTMSCSKEGEGGPKMSYPPISEQQKNLQDEFELILNDEDSYSIDGSSIDTVIINQLYCSDDTSCTSVILKRPNDQLFYLDSEDLIVLSNGGILMKNIHQDSSTINELFLENLTGHAADYPYLELASINGSAYLNNGKILGLDIDERQIIIEIWGPGVSERVVLELVE